MAAVAVKDKPVGAEVCCPGCMSVGTLFYLSQWVMRGSNWPGLGCIEGRETPVPMCRCEVCKKRFRVLPTEILPYKSYTRQVIETTCSTYVAASRPTESLQKTVARLGKMHPHPSALHGWLGGLGARALGRFDRHAVGPPVAALITESAKCIRGAELSLWMQPQSVSKCKYRSQRRLEQLEACARLFETARRLFPTSPYAWLAWEVWLQTRFHVTAWGFPARFRGTAIQEADPRRVTVACQQSSREPRPQRKGKTNGARSPP